MSNRNHSLIMISDDEDDYKTSLINPPTKRIKRERQVKKDSKYDYLLLTSDEEDNDNDNVFVVKETKKQIKNEPVLKKKSITHSMTISDVDDNDKTIVMNQPKKKMKTECGIKKETKLNCENTSMVMISDDEDNDRTFVISQPKKRIKRERQVKKDSKYDYLLLTSDEEDNDNDSVFVVKETKKQIKNERVLKKKSITQSMTISDVDDNDKTIAMDQPKKKVKTECGIKKETKLNCENTSMVMISDDEDNDRTFVISQPKKVIKKEPKIKTESRIKTEPNVKTKQKREICKDLLNSDNGENDKTGLSKQCKPKPTTTRKRKNTNDNNCDLKPGTSKESILPKAKKLCTAGVNSGINKVASGNYEAAWRDHELLADSMSLNHNIAKNIINLFNDGGTIPFIARYRRDATGNMSPEVLREVKSAYDGICHLKEKIKTVVNTLQKTGHMNKQLETIVKSAKSLEELEIIYTPYKPEGKRTLAERAKALGLEQPALELLINNSVVDLNLWVDKSKDELQTVAEIEKGIIHIIAHKIATDSDVLEFLRDIRKQIHFTVETKKLQSKQTTKSKKNVIAAKPVDESKFKMYFDFQSSVSHIKPHQVLAINRGEHHKVLSVKINTSSYLGVKFQQFCYKKWVSQGRYNENRRRILEEAIKDSYNRLVQPFMVRVVRTQLKTMAEKASYEVFSKNLKHILLAGPIKGQTILGIDPGYKHGCKIAIISPTGIVLDHGVIYPHSSQSNRENGKKILRDMLDKYDCSLISLGDATASKETEEWITSLIKNKYFYPRDVKYTIVSEDGASIYSCSPEAKKEFADLDTNIISAVSLARRIQDPLAELVKVEPKHLGVGMYQHDLKKKTLDEALDEVVSECVSFVGVDLNTASQCLLRRIAGLSDKRATEIVNYREKHGPFISREQLLKVSGIGPKIFQQCAGFLRVGPTNASTIEFYKKSKTNKLDQTIIHPESYNVTEKLLKSLKFDVDDIGESQLITKIKSIKTELPEVSHQLDTTIENLDLIIDALEKPLDYDLRTEIPQAAFFSSGLKSFDDLSVGSKVMGRVKNVTHFGCFVDIGVGTDCLIHSSKLGSFDLQIGDRVEGVVCTLDRERMRVNVKPTAKI